MDIAPTTRTLIPGRMPWFPWGLWARASTTTITPSPTTTLPVSTPGTSTSPRSSSTAWLS
ncbi:rCG57468 [Rattus norvegicus]|uniref:RCG57468 n=1 Tax=Rattus norvegicus TaxID=10116 RepID=A6JHF5_RAT|nr:rCG57468 [Rattus norvegicus]